MGTNQPPGIVQGLPREETREKTMIEQFEKLFRECRETLFDQFKATLCGVPADLKASWDAETDKKWAEAESDFNDWWKGEHELDGDPDFT